MHTYLHTCSHTRTHTQFLKTNGSLTHSQVFEDSETSFYPSFKVIRISIFLSVKYKLNLAVFTCFSHKVAVMTVIIEVKTVYYLMFVLTTQQVRKIMIPHTVGADPGSHVRGPGVPSL